MADPDPEAIVDEWPAKLDELAGRWRGDAVRVPERASVSIEKVAKDLGLVTRREFDELELRLAQLEHPLSLLERDCWSRGLDHPQHRGASPRSPRPRSSTASAISSRRHRLTDLLPWRARETRSRKGRAVPARAAPARDAGRARGDLRQVRPAALDAARRRPARHRHRAAPSRTTSLPVPIRRRRARHRRATRLSPSSACSSSSPSRRSRPLRSARCTGLLPTGTASPSSARPNAPRQIEADLALLYQAADREGAGARARLHRHAWPRGRFARLIRQELDYRHGAGTPSPSAGTSPAIRMSASAKVY